MTPNENSFSTRLTEIILLGLATCLLVWLHGAVFKLPTATHHQPDQTYIPSGLYLATASSLTVVIVATVLIDNLIGRPSNLAFVVGFSLGLVWFLFKLPWSHLDRGGKQMFSISEWWVAPMTGTAIYLASAMFERMRS